MSFKVSLCALLLGATLAAHAEPRVHSVLAKQNIMLAEENSGLAPGRVAIDGDFAIVISNYGGGRLAYLYQRSATGEWRARATLLAVQTSTFARDDDVAMANGIAALRIGDGLHIYERSGDTYVESATAGTPRAAPGLAISGRRIIAARRGCNYDADIFQKSVGSGVWGVAGRIRGAAGECNDHGAALDLDGDVALVRNSPTEIREYRRSGTDVNWVHVGTITPPAGATFTLDGPTLSGNVAFVSDGRYFERQGSSWTYRGRVEPKDSATGAVPFNADYRGGLLLTTSGATSYRADKYPNLYLRNGAGGFDHVAELFPPGTAVYADVSGSRAVVMSRGYFEDINLSFFELPAPLAAPSAIANDFEARDISGWQQEAGSQFALASTAKGVVYRQSSLAGKSTAFLTGTEWFNAQSVEADITPTAINGSDRWVGLAVRYVDANNHYYVTLRSSNKLLLQRMVTGVFQTLGETTLPFSLNSTYHVKLVVNGSHLGVYVNDDWRLGAIDNALTHGRAALMTNLARADFDNVYAGSTQTFTLDYRAFGDIYDFGPDFTEQGGNWEIIQQDDGPGDLTFAQTNASSTDARAFIGAPTGDQVVRSLARVDSYSSSTAGWFGLLARWVDARTYYYLAVRSVGRLDIRKKVNGTITVLKTVPFTATPGRYYDLKLAVIGNQLHAYVDDVFIAGAVDNDIPSGRYGLGTSQAAARFQTFEVMQP